MKKSVECQSAHCHDFCVSRLYESHAFLRDREERERECKREREREKGEKERIFLSFKKQSVLLKKLIHGFNEKSKQFIQKFYVP